MYDDFSYIPPPPTEDSDEEDEKLKPLNWKNNSAVLDKIDLFVLFEHESAVEFANKCIVKKTYEIDRIDDVGLVLYKLADSDVVVCTTLCRSSKTYGEIVSVLQPWLSKASNRIMVQTSPLAHYRTYEMKNTSMIQALKTNLQDDTPTLEIPNILTAVSAGVINYCDFFKLPAIVYVCYLETDIYGLDKPIADKLTNKLKGYKVPFIQAFCSRQITSTTYM